MTPRICVMLLACALTTGCRATGGGSGAVLVQPGAPGEPTRAVAVDEATAAAELGFDEADVRFVRGMIGHHAQALEMTSLLATHTSRDEMRMLAKRIDASQRDEIAMMEEWLDARGQARPAAHGHAGGSGLMPGMLTPEELERLAQARGAAFDHLFLELMIRHHEGALDMVQALFSSPGAAQDSDVFAFASDVEADQRMEIRRMQIMLAGYLAAPAPH